jgi:hypothetical protein
VCKLCLYPSTIKTALKIVWFREGIQFEETIYFNMIELILTNNDNDNEFGYFAIALHKGTTLQHIPIGPGLLLDNEVKPDDVRRYIIFDMDKEKLDELIKKLVRHHFFVYVLLFFNTLLMFIVFD